MFLSSHIISEVERTTSRVAIIREGRIVRVDQVSALRDLSHHEVTLVFTGPVPTEAFAALEGVSHIQPVDHTLRHAGDRPDRAGRPGSRTLRPGRLLSVEPSLEDVFLAEYGREAVDVR